jgi:O-antigen ligase
MNRFSSRSSRGRNSQSGKSHRRAASASPAAPGAAALVLFFIAAIVLGGASADASLHTLVLQSLCLGFLAFALVRFRWHGAMAGDRPALWLVLFFLAVVLVQIVPLPESLWSALPGRTTMVAALGQLGLRSSWLPLSVDPQGTITSIQSILVIGAVVLLGGRSPEPPARQASVAICALAILSILLGAAQIRAGTDSALYLHSYTNWGLAVGFFANANHLANLLLISLPLAAVLVATARDKRLDLQLRAVILAGYSLCVAGGIYLTSSNAGLALWLPVTGASFLLLFPALRPSLAGWLGSALLVVSLVALAAWQTGLMPIVFRDNLADAPGSRLTMAHTTWAAIKAFWPVGSGLGTFDQVYPLFEDQAAVTAVYANHAHNDYLELVLELGAAGILFVIGCLAWWGVRTVAAWRASGPDAHWRRAASIVLGIVIVHSLVDYPLRTPAILAITTFFALVLATGREARAGEGAATPGSAREDQEAGGAVVP